MNWSLYLVFFNRNQFSLGVMQCEQLQEPDPTVDVTSNPHTNNNNKKTTEKRVATWWSNVLFAKKKKRRRNENIASIMR